MRYFDRNTWYWIFLAGLFFLPFLGGVHLFDWDEINFAELAREMVVTGDFFHLQINYQTFTEKPPFFFWVQAVSMKIFGVGEMAARLPNAILGIFVLPFIYIMGKALVDRRFGFLWALSWFGSTLPFLYFKSGIIDPYFNFFIFTGLYCLIHFIWKKTSSRNIYFSASRLGYLWIAGISAGLGIITKGPVAYLVVVLTLGFYWFVHRFKNGLPFSDFIRFSLIALLVCMAWMGADLVINGPDFIIEFTIRQWELLTTSDAGHGGFPGYHFVVLLFGCFPASIFAIRGMGRFSNMNEHVRDFQRWMLVLFWVVLILFSLVSTKIIHYSSLAYYPLTFFAALALWNILDGNIAYRSWLTVLLIFIGLAGVVISLALPWLGHHPEVLKDLLANDPFAVANLNAEVAWSLWDYIPGIWLLLVLIIFILISPARERKFKVLFYGNAIWVMLSLIFFINKIERISQQAAVAFFEEQQGENVYVTTYGYRSYVPWFYAKVQPYGSAKPKDQDWLLHGDTDRPVMISAKITSREDLEKNIQDAEFLYEKNGFVFYRRN